MREVCRPGRLVAGAGRRLLRAEHPAQGRPEPAPLVPLPTPVLLGSCPAPSGKALTPFWEEPRCPVCTAGAGEAFGGTEGERWPISGLRVLGGPEPWALPVIPVGAAPVAAARLIAWGGRKTTAA